jgi:hypothetical protein
MRLVRLETPDGPILVNPEYVVSVRKGLRETSLQTVTGAYTVRESPEVVARLLGAEEIPIDVTPALDWQRSGG